MKAVILAGGYGTRMRPLTFSRPKPLMPILNKPITEHILDLLKEHNVTDVAITTNYLREQIQDYFGTKYKGMSLTYPTEENPLGTAGCVKNIEGFLDETFIIMQGDTVTDMNLSYLLKQHKLFSGLATIAAKRVEDPWNFGIMEISDDNRIKMFHEKPSRENCVSDMINTGIYIMEPEVLDHIPAGRIFDFSKDLFPSLVESQTLFAQPLDGFWADIGRPSGYTDAKNWMMSQLKRSISDTCELNGKVEGEVMVGEGVKVGKHSHIIGPVVLGDHTIIEEGVVIGPNTVIGGESHVRSNTFINGAVLFERADVGQNEEILNAFIAEGVRIAQMGRIQSDVIIGGSCSINENVSIINGSRIWPNMEIERDAMVSGTLKRFVQMHEMRSDPKWVLRNVSPDEAFYFNKFEHGHVSFTGARALSLWDFKNIVKNIEISSLVHHLREDKNDFKAWAERVLGDKVLAEEFDAIKVQFPSVQSSLREQIIALSNERLNILIDDVKKPGYS